METISQARKVIEEGLSYLDKKDSDGLKYNGLSVPEIMQNAMGMLNGDEEKIAIAKAWSVQEANRIIGFLWRAELLTKDLEKAYRKLPKLDEVAADYNAFLDKHKAEAAELEEQRKKYADRQRDLDIFQGIFSGRTKEQVERDYDNYQTQMRQSMGVK